MEGKANGYETIWDVAIYTTTFLLFRFTAFGGTCVVGVSAKGVTDKDIFSFKG